MWQNDLIFIKRQRRRGWLTAVLITAALALCGCGDTQFNDDIQTTVELNETETSKKFETDYEITEWSPDDFRTVQCCGVNITIPCKLSDINKEFNTQMTEGEVSGAKFVELYYNDEYVGALSSIGGTELLTVAILDKFSVNGLSETSTKEDVQSILGNGNVIDCEVLDSYYVNNSVVSFTYSDESKTEICICFYEENDVTGAQLNYDIQTTVEPIDNQLTDINETEMKIIEPPADGWTLDNINQVLYMNGQQVKLPILFSSLGDEYEIRDKKYNTDENSLDYNVIAGKLYYKNEFIAIISFTDTGNDMEILTMIFAPNLYDEIQNYSEYITINGLGLKNRGSDVYDFLGEKFEKDSGIITYDIADSDYLLEISDTEEDIMIIFKVSYNKVG